MSNPTSEGAMAARAVAERLREAGFEVVRTSAQASDLGADVIAWAANASGQVVPWVAVEVKASSKKPTPPQIALPRLARARDGHGTQEHYIVIDGDWYRADRALRSVAPVKGPAAPPYGTKGIVADESLVENALRQRWERMDRRRGRASMDELRLEDVESLVEGKLTTPQGESLTVASDVVWDAGRRVLSSFGQRRTGYSEYLSHPAISEAVAELLGDDLAGLVLDPFCGTGSFLWAVAERAKAENTSVELIGRDLNEHSVTIARLIGGSSSVNVDIDVADSFEADLPNASVAVTAPPAGVRLLEPRLLINGEYTRDLDVAAVDLVLERLDHEGRAVFFLPRSFATRSESYRRFLAREFWVGALIGTPRGSIPGTNLPGLLMVVDKTLGPGRTFVGQVDDDGWVEQLAPGGPLLEAARRHLDETGNPRP